MNDDELKQWIQNAVKLDADWKARVAKGFREIVKQHGMYDENENISILLHWLVNEIGRLREGRRKDSEIIISLETKVNQILHHIEKSPRFKKPTEEMVIDYAAKLEYVNFDVDGFMDHYEANGWKVGKVGMKSWEAAVRNWQKNRTNFQPPALENPLDQIAKSVILYKDEEKKAKEAGSPWSDAKKKDMWDNEIINPLRRHKIDMKAVWERVNEMRKDSSA